MFRKTTILLAPVLTVLLAQIAVAADRPAPAAAWISQDAVLVLEVPRPKVLLDRVFSDRVVQAVTSLPVYKEQAAKPDFQQGLNLISHFEGRYDMKLPALLGKLLGGGITWALGPHNASLLIVDAEDAKMLDEIHEFFLLIARNEAQKQDKPGRVTSAEYRGVTGWSFGPNETHAIIGNRLLISNKPEALKTALDLRAQPGGKSLANLAGYQAAKKAAGADSTATVFANMSVLKQIPGLNKALTQNENPLATLLFAPLLGSLRESTWLGVGVDVDVDNLNLEVVTDGGATDSSAPEGFGRPEQPAGGALPNLVVPRQIAGVSFYRDLHRFYAAKDKLFPERTSGLIFFENMMGIFFTGRDLTEEVLAQTAPEVRLVVAEQKYDPKIGTPKLQIPAFAAVLRMRDPKKFAPVVEEAWQKALGLINFTRGQQAEPGLVIDRPTHAGIKYTMASFLSTDEGDKTVVDTRYNFQPSLAMPGEYLVLSSSDALTRDLIDALKKETAAGVKPLAGTHSLAEIDGVQLASILKANLEGLIRNNMVKEGNTREQAETELNVLMSILKYLRRAKLNATSGDRQSKLTFKLDFDLP